MEEYDDWGGLEEVVVVENEVMISSNGKTIEEEELMSSGYFSFCEDPGQSETIQVASISTESSVNGMGNEIGSTSNGCGEFDDCQRSDETGFIHQNSGSVLPTPENSLNCSTSGSIASTTTVAGGTDKHPSPIPIPHLCLNTVCSPPPPVINEGIDQGAPQVLLNQVGSSGINVSAQLPPVQHNFIVPHPEFQPVRVSGVVDGGGTIYLMPSSSPYIGGIEMQVPPSTFLQPVGNTMQQQLVNIQLQPPVYNNPSSGFTLSQQPTLVNLNPINIQKPTTSTQQTLNKSVPNPRGCAKPIEIDLTGDDDDDGSKQNKSKKKSVPSRKRKQPNSSPKTNKKGMAKVEAKTEQCTSKSLPEAKQVKTITTENIRKTLATANLIPLPQKPTQVSKNSSSSAQANLPKPETASSSKIMEPQPKLIYVGGNPIQGTSVKSRCNNLEDETPDRNCIVCLRHRPFTENIYEAETEKNAGTSSGQNQFLTKVETLLSNLCCPLYKKAMTGNSKEVGICSPCLNFLQRWHIFKNVISFTHNNLRKLGADACENPIVWEVFEPSVYRNFRLITMAKDTYASASHAHLVRRKMGNSDWDIFCDLLFKTETLEGMNQGISKLKKFMLSDEILTGIYCVNCSILVKSGLKGFVNHVKSAHPNKILLLPCDFCGEQFPLLAAASKLQDYFAHWITHFYLETCEQCGDKFQNNWHLKYHKETQHKVKLQDSVSDQVSSSSNVKCPILWKCTQCNNVFEDEVELTKHAKLHAKDKVSVNNAVCGDRGTNKKI